MAFGGPITTNTLSGGGSFSHFLDHLKPALKTWLDDMEQNQLNCDSCEAVNDLKDKVNVGIKCDPEDVESSRDAFLSSPVGDKVRASDKN